MLYKSGHFELIRTVLIGMYAVRMLMKQVYTQLIKLDSYGI